ncbi:MAG: hypothetical protein IBX43_06405 [Campylobacterales bacterium]|nr:hypothetical protein [Campylobacterales bacterium]
MISPRLFKLLLFFALGLISLQLLSGIWLFIEKYGLTPGEVYLYFAGDEANFIMAKSVEGLLETAVPHFVAVSATIFVYAHFLLFTKEISEKRKQLLIFGLFLTALIDIFSPLGILYGCELFAWLKVLSFWGFEILMGVLLYMLFSLYLLQKRA